MFLTPFRFICNINVRLCEPVVIRNKAIDQIFFKSAVYYTLQTTYFFTCHYSSPTSMMINDLQRIIHTRVRA
jgi:hypothetical protein